MNRRRMIAMAGLAPVAFSAGALSLVSSAAAAVKRRPDAEVAADEDFWFTVQQAFSIDPRYIILNAGVAFSSPLVVHEAHKQYLDLVNRSPYIHTRRTGIAGMPEVVRQRLAQFINASPEEVAILRNTTEGLNTVFWGLDLKPGDEVLVSTYEYHTALDSLHQRAKRHGIVVRSVKYPMPVTSMKPIIDAYHEGITPKTKLVLVSHTLNAIGQTMPVKEICAKAREHGALSLVDGALAFGYLPVDVADIGCDYYATSLHKALGAPFASGLFYVRKDRIASTWPLFGVEEKLTGDIRKFEQYGKPAYAGVAAIADALEFYATLGVGRKAARLHYLKKYWTDQVKSEPRVKFGVSLEPEHSCGTVHMAIEGIEGKALSDWFYDKKRIYAWGPHETDAGSGVYVSVNIYNRLSELDTFVAAVREAARNGIG